MVQNRDDFSRSVARDLAASAGYQCSNPDCRRGTSGPRANSAKPASNGVAAHICAAAPGGARYESSMTAEERSANANGIWLCNACSRQIDSDVDGHPVKLLQEWRRSAEADAKRRMVVRPLNEHDVVQRLQSTLAALPTAQSRLAVGNVHQATEAYLNSLDKRITVESSYARGMQALALKAKDPVEFQMTFKSAADGAAEDALMRLFAHGDDACFEAEEVAIDGSPLLQHLLSSIETTRIEINPIPTPVALRVLLRDSSGRSRVMEEAAASAVFGAESMKFEGACFGGLIGFKARTTSDGAGGLRHRVEVRFDTKTWDKRDIRLLPEFDRTQELMLGLFGGDRLCIEVLTEQRALIGADVTSLKEVEGARYFGALLAYTGYARRATQFLNVRVPFVHEHEFDGDEISILERCARACERTLTGPYAHEMEATVAAEDVPPDVLDPAHPPFTMRIQGATQDTVRIFNQIVELPQLLIDVPARVIFTEPVDGGAKVRVVARQAEGVSATYFFADKASVMRPPHQL